MANLDLSNIKLGDKFPITIKIVPNKDLKIEEGDLSFKIADSGSHNYSGSEASYVKIFNSRGGMIKDADFNLFVDNKNGLVGYIWDTNDTSQNLTIGDSYKFEFTLFINYKGNILKLVTESAFKTLNNTNS